MTILYGNGAGIFPTEATFSTSGNDGYLVTADFDNDGDTDIAVASSSTKSVDLIFNHGTGSFGAPESITLDAAPWGIAADDFDQDGRIDVAVTRADNTVQILWNRNGVAVTPANFSLKENSLETVVVGTVTATGKAPITYAITAGNSDLDGDSKHAFAIDAATGVITVNDSGDLDFETVAQFDLQVKVTDADDFSDTADVIVKLTNVDEPGNDRPEIQDGHFTLPENTAGGAKLGAVIVADVDVGDTLTYAITAGNFDPNGNSNPAFDIDTAT